MTPLLSRVKVALLVVAVSGGGAAAQPTMSATLVSELVPDGHLDPGEGGVVNVCIRNAGSSPFGALTVDFFTDPAISALLGTGGSVSYPSLAPGDVACRPVAMRAAAVCGVATNGAAFIASDSFSQLVRFPIGIGPHLLAETFDGVESGQLPAGWTATASPGATPWTAFVGSPTQSPPRRAFAAAPPSYSENILQSPSFPVPAGTTLLAFANFYNFEFPVDGGVLEIATDGGPFVDIIAAGGTFLQGGYTATLTPNTGPIPNRPAWTGTGSVTTIVSLPAAAAGHVVQLRWRLGTDISIGGAGWGIDSVYVGTNTCATVPTTTPWGLQSTVRGNLLSLTWQAPLGPAPTSYVVDASLDGGTTFPFSFPATTTAFSITAPDVAVSMRVRALYGASPSPPSNVVAFGVGFLAPPGQVTNLLSSVNGSELTLAWVPPTEGGTAIGTRLEAGSGPGLANLAVLPLPVSTTSLVVPGVPPGTYHLRVRHVGPALPGPPSRDVVVTVPATCAPPLTPRLAITKTGGTVTIAWQLPRLGSPAPSHHVLEAGTAPNTANLVTVPLPGYSLSVAPLPGTYHIRMLAVNSCGNSARTPNFSFTVP